MEIKAVWLGLIVAASCVLPGTVSAADASHQNEGGQKMESCKQMMAERDKMMSEIKRGDQKLASLAGQLNQVSGQQKVDLLAKIVIEMVSERATAHEQMEAMHSRMMRHMAQHMQQGADSMAQCPMMHKMEGMGGLGNQVRQQGHSSHHESSGSRADDNAK